MPKELTKVASKISKVLFENDRVKVVELTWKKGQKIEMHSHPEYFGYAETPIKYKSTNPEGKTENRSIKKGEVTWYDAESHSVEVMGGSGKVLIVELKK